MLRGALDQDPCSWVLLEGHWHGRAGLIDGCGLDQGWLLGNWNNCRLLLEGTKEEEEGRGGEGQWQR